MIKINYIYIHYTRSNFTTMKFLITIFSIAIYAHHVISLAAGCVSDL